MGQGQSLVAADDLVGLCKDHDSKKLAKAVKGPEAIKYLQKPLLSDKNKQEWPTVAAFVLSTAILANSVECMIILLPHVDVRTTRDKDRNTLLHCAIASKYVAAARLLVLNGADVNARDGKGWLPIHLATASNSVEMLSILCVKGVGINNSLASGATPLCLAVQHHHTECVSTLLAHGADVDRSDEEWKALTEFATEKGFFDIVELLDGARVRELQRKEDMFSFSFHLGTTPEEAFQKVKELRRDTATINYLLKCTGQPEEESAEEMDKKPQGDKLQHNRSSGEGIRSNSSADQPDQAFQSNPWESEEYRLSYPKLIRVMHPSQVRNLCFSLQLLDEYEMEDIDAKPTRHAKNSAILAALSSSPEKFARFREVLHNLNGLGLSDIVTDLDKLSPDRERDQDCLVARHNLEM